MLMLFENEDLKIQVCFNEAGAHHSDWWFSVVKMISWWKCNPSILDGSEWNFFALNRALNRELNREFGEKIDCKRCEVQTIVQLLTAIQKIQLEYVRSASRWIVDAIKWIDQCDKLSDYQGWKWHFCFLNK